MNRMIDEIAARAVAVLAAAIMLAMVLAAYATVIFVGSAIATLCVLGYQGYQALKRRHDPSQFSPWREPAYGGVIRLGEEITWQ